MSDRSHFWVSSVEETTSLRQLRHEHFEAVLRGIEIEMHAETMPGGEPYENLGRRIMDTVTTPVSTGVGYEMERRLVRPIFRSGWQAVRGGVNLLEMWHGMELARRDVIGKLKTVATPLDAENMLQVATTFAENDVEIGYAVRNALQRAGDMGAIIIQTGSEPNIQITPVPGLRMDWGLASRSFVTALENHTLLRATTYELSVLFLA
jgi:chaperonin GroEL